MLKISRSRQIEFSPSTIIQIFSLGNKNVSKGDVLTFYGPSLHKNPNSRIKAQLMHADIIDRDGHMAIVSSKLV